MSDRVGGVPEGGSRPIDPTRAFFNNVDLELPDNHPLISYGHQGAISSGRNKIKADQKSTFCSLVNLVAFSAVKPA